MNPEHQQKNIVQGSIKAGGNVHIGDIITYVINEQKLEIPVRLTNFIPPDASHVVGRNDELAETHQKLSNNKPTVLVNGIGGIGKTTLALKYMVTYTPQYQHVAWLNAAAGVQSAFIQDTALLDALHLRRDVEDCINATQPDKAFDLVFKRLNDLAQNTEGGKKILVVLDNANDLANLLAHKKYFDTAHIHVLITSRANPEGWQMVKVESLPKEQALELFKNIYPSVLATDEELDTVLSHLFYHTLLIELVAKAAKANAMEFDCLRQAINEKFIHDPDLQKRKVNVENHSVTIGEEVKRAKIEEYIWLIFKNVKDLPDTAKEMLRAFALLPPPTSFDEDFLTQHFTKWQITEDVYDILDISLVERGWLDKCVTQNRSAYSMHPLIAEVVVKHLEVNITFAEAYIIHIADLLYYDYLNPKHNLFKKNENKPLAERLIELFSTENVEGISDLLDNSGNLEEEFGFYHKGAAFREKALQIAEVIFDKNHKKIALRQSSLANVYRNLGRYEEATKLLEYALTSDFENYGENHQTYAVSQSNLANSYKYLGRYDKAAVLLESALISDLKHLGSDNPEVAKKQSNLALVYRNLGRYKEAAILLENALASDLKNFIKNHPEVAKKHSNLGLVYRNLGFYHKAAELLETAIAYDLENFGKEHPYIATKQSNLALVYISLKRYDQAAELLENSLSSDLKNFGSRNPIVAIRQLNLGNAYRYLGKYDKATDLLEAALASDLENFNQEHPDVLRKQSSLGILYHELGRYDQAINLLETALRNGLISFGANHPEIATIQNNLAHVYNSIGRNVEAKALWKTAYQNSLLNLGAEHARVIEYKVFAEI
jgi:tetratricopeptide (TPR) repeat protein